MIPKLSPKLRDLLLECLQSRPDLQNLVCSSEPVTLNPEQKNEIRILIGNELCRSGLKENDEPNRRGLDLEDLVSQVCRPE